MLSVIVIWRPCNKGTPAVTADIPLHPELNAVLHFPEACAVLHNVPGTALRAHWIHEPDESVLLQLHVHHGYIVDHENRE